MIRAYFIRHCAAAGQEAEAPLTEEGYQQAKWLADILKSTGLKRIISSTFKRAIQSASPLAIASGLILETDGRLCERNLGTVPGGDWLKALALTYEKPDLRYREGETSNEATSRARELVDETLNSRSYPVAFLTHGNVLSLVARSFEPSLGFEFWRTLKNPDIFELHDEGSSVKFQRMAL